ncbi:acyl-CoA dehydrogenase family protein [Rhizobium cremeum]|uniref:acyl-CoA dehydrogenase family protein n=1 Tax=Rhizobium cremeum TaxID=2813827 RepID=UPI001FD167D1|nr:acyl-CoA dehydrogenase family protein [Rhizobium cremeum]MCJ7994468.1 acyl-CoA dehydrogenase family protein [Rhizobium cremeum]MCJ7999967.1 acyl-CoA dehydrogenase family protein [Rhizobium cremeum]
MMTSAPDRLRPVPATLPTEGHVIAAVEAFLRAPLPQGRDGMSALSRTGLLAISIPAAFGGADISNTIVAEAVSRLAVSSKDLAIHFARHLVALELLRTSGSIEQRKALYTRVVLGETFERLSILPGDHVPRLVRQGLSFTVEPAPAPGPASEADWRVVAGLGPGTVEVAAILPGTHWQAEDDEAVPSAATSVSPDHVLEMAPEASLLAEFMETFLDGAILRGEYDDASGSGMPDNLSVEFELLDAMILKVASVIDIIQVDQSQLDVARILRLRQALEAARRRSGGATVRGR